MTKLVNRAKMTTATTGTGTITLGSAVDGYQTFANAGVANADVVRYVIEDGDAWEIGSGTYSSGTLTRVLDESSTGSLLNLSGEAVVYVTAAGEDIQQPPSEGPFVDGDKTKLDNIEAGATADQTAGEIKTAYESNANTNAFTDAEQTKLAGIEATADVTDAGNVNPLVDAHLNTSSATSGEYLSWTGSDYDWVAVSGYTDADVDTHLNTGTASSGEVLSWNGSDYDWITSGGAFSVIGTRNLAGIATLPDITTGTDNFAAGNNAGVNITTGSNNVAIGNGALDAATTGGRNIAIGQDAMGLGVATAASGDNIAIGYQAGYDLTTGDKNFLAGKIAGANLTSGSDNVMIGDGAGSNTVTGNANILVGRLAGRFITSNDNIFLGDLTGDAATTGSANVAIGRRAFRSLTTGVNNVAVGGAGGITTGSNNVLIGNGSTPSSATVSNEITLGNSSIATLRCQVTTITSLSDARDKMDIQPLSAGLDFVNALEPVSFTWNMRDGGKVGEADTGFIAQDLQAAQAKTGVTIPDLVYDVNPDKLEAGYGKLIPVLVQAIKDLSDKVKDLEARLEGK